MKVKTRKMPSGEETAKFVYVGKVIREEKKLSIRKLGAKSGVAISSITNWEHNKALPDLRSLAVIAQALEVDPWELVEYDPPLKIA